MEKAAVKHEGDDGPRKPQAAEQSPDGPDKAKVKYKNLLPRDEAVSYFEAIVAGLRRGTLTFKHGEDSVVLAPGESVFVEVKAERKGDRERVEFEITWRGASNDRLTISSD